MALLGSWLLASPCMTQLPWLGEVKNGFILQRDTDFLKTVSHIEMFWVHFFSRWGEAKCLFVDDEWVQSVQSIERCTVHSVIICNGFGGISLQTDVETMWVFTIGLRIKCKKMKCHNFDSNTNGENPRWFQYLDAKIFPKNTDIGSYFFPM